MYRNPPTPIPLGSPHLADPPMFDRWGLLKDDRSARDRRVYNRRDVRCDVWLMDVHSGSVVRCRTDDISDAGLRCTSPVGYGLGVGQRYEIRIASRDAAHAPSSKELLPSLGYGTVVRLELRRDMGDAHRVGFAIRFDTPQLLPV